jgi:hypothetical protein
MPSEVVDPGYHEYLSKFIGGRAFDLIPVKRLPQAHAHVSLSSHWDADPLSPFGTIERALTRETNAVTSLKTAIALVTIDAAYALGQDDTSGSLEVGKYADYTIIDQNLFGIDTDEIDQTEVLLTVLAGRELYRAPLLEAPDRSGSRISSDPRYTVNDRTSPFASRWSPPPAAKLRIKAAAWSSSAAAAGKCSSSCFTTRVCCSETVSASGWADRIEALRQPRDLASRHPVDPELTDELVDAPRGDAGEMRIGDHRDESLLRSAAALVEPVGEVGALPELRDRQLDRAHAGVPAALAIAVADVDRSGERSP